MKTIAIIIFSILTIGATIYTTASGNAQPDFKSPAFWSSMPAPIHIEKNVKGLRSDEQQAKQTMWFCLKAAETTPDWFDQNYASIDDCTKRNLSAKPVALKEIRLVRNFPDHEETVGYTCMTDAMWDNCSEATGFCHWSAVMDQYTTCVREAQ